ncbi:putative bifunctional diguanylate cyclase/phosphodiesterase [Marinimicrobium sp. C2-29]|uniref:putative bifunctional diguanylate cyclase/phosphodiesterase n=1 Tax=Marinimicrobium sp. C2-29 TaxID=3139825 RepID=UPI0031395BC3
MDESLRASELGQWRVSQLFLWPSRTQRAISLLVICLLLLLGAATVYSTGGTAYAYPYLMLIPVLFASAWYGVAGGLIAGLAAGILMAFMPLNVESGQMQSTFNWALRLSLYLGLGAVAGGLFQALRSSFQKHDRLVRTDRRSKLPNQASLNGDLAYWVSSSHTFTRTVGLIFVRISDIADVLEAMGADASDELAALVGQRLNTVVSESGSVYRFSESELVVLLPATDTDRLSQVIEDIIEAGEQNLVLRGVPVRVQLILGSSWKTGGSVSGDDLVREARLALFAALKSRLSHCEYTPALTQKTLSTIKLISSVSLGLERNEFELHYQPKISLDSGAVSGGEALIRWRDAEGGVIMPGKFMPKVENTTLIGPVTRFVISECCDFLADYPQQVSFNFSSRNLLDPTMPDFLEAMALEHGIAPERLEVEITESALIHNLEAARQAIERIRAVGFGVSIDDFGTGFASFDYLRRLPITGIKIDRAFVRDLEADERARKLMACMIDVGHALRLTVTAEGVETEGQYGILQALGCDQIQGFYITPALPPAQFLTWRQHH